LRIPAPGTPGYYPEGDELAARPCAWCGEPVGYGVPFYYTSETGTELQHDRCRRARAKQTTAR
jgi:hypothetical protein